MRIFLLRGNQVCLLILNNSLFATWASGHFKLRHKPSNPQTSQLLHHKLHQDLRCSLGQVDFIMYHLMHWSKVHDYGDYGARSVDEIFGHPWNGFRMLSLLAQLPQSVSLEN